MSKELKELFVRVFNSKGVDSWTAKHKENYILQLKNSDSPDAKDLFLNVLRSGLSPEQIYEKIKDIDIGLKVFLKFLHEHESYARKSVHLYKLDLEEGQKKEILDNVNVKDFTHLIPKKWEPIEVNKEGNIITILIGKLAYQASNVDLNEKKFNDNKTWEQIKKILLDSNVSDKDFDALKTLKANLLQEKRIVSKVKIDLTNKYLELGLDNSYVQEDGTRVKEEDSINDKNAIFDIVEDKLNLDDDLGVVVKNLIVHDKADKSLITEESFNKLNDLREEHFIIVSKIKTFSIKHKSQVENDENVTAAQDNQRKEKLEKAVKEYYDARGNLSGFFDKYPQFDTDNGMVTGDLNEQSRRLDNVNIRRFYGWGVLVRDKSSNEKGTKGNSDKGHLAGKVIDIITFELDRESRKLNISNNNYSKEIYETIISKLL